MPKFDGNYYGTARRFLHEAEQKGHDLLLDIDVQGAAQIQKKLPDATSIFILPPDRKTLEERLRKRGEDREEVIQRRLIAASREIRELRPVQLHSRQRTFGRIDQEPASDRAMLNACSARGGHYPERNRKLWLSRTAAAWPTFATA